jgi:hypothetical protein
LRFPFSSSLSLHEGILKLHYNFTIYHSQQQKKVETGKVKKPAFPRKFPLPAFLKAGEVRLTVFFPFRKTVNAELMYSSHTP